MKNSRHGEDDLLSRFVCALETIASLRSNDCLATKEDLFNMEKRIMSAISDFSAKVDTAFDEIATAVDGIVADIQWLKDKISELQNSPGTITPEDQALLNALESKVAGMVTKVKDLDAATEEPPTP